MHLLLVTPFPMPPLLLRQPIQQKLLFISSSGRLLCALQHRTVAGLFVLCNTEQRLACSQREQTATPQNNVHKLVLLIA
jgi:hypothetical protein